MITNERKMKRIIVSDMTSRSEKCLLTSRHDDRLMTDAQPNVVMNKYAYQY